MQLLSNTFILAEKDQGKVIIYFHLAVIALKH